MLEFYSSSTKWCHEYLPSLTIEIRRKSTSRLKYLDEKLSDKSIDLSRRINKSYASERYIFVFGVRNFREQAM